MLTTLEVYSSQSTAPDLPLVMGSREDVDLIHIRDIDGLGPVKANVASQSYGASDGGFATGATVGMRNVTLKVGFNPDWVTHTVASLRQTLYAYFMPKQSVTLRLFRDDGPTVEIKGIVEDCAPSIFSKDPEVSISVLCPDPDFVAVSESYVEGWAFDSPVYTTDFTALSNVPAPFTIDLEYISGEEYSGLVTVQKWDEAPLAKAFQVTGDISLAMYMHISSVRGNKVAQNLLPEDDPINLLNTMTDESEWLYITPGTNRFKVILESGVTETIRWTIRWHERFGGL